MKPIVEKVLKSGLVNKHTVLMLERFGQLPAGSSELVNESALKDATQAQLVALAEEIGNEVDKERTLKETQLDLDKLRWPAVATILDDKGVFLAHDVSAVIDRMGRLYFRIQDVMPSWFVPGFTIERQVLNKETGHKTISREQILEVTTLFTDEMPVCVQVTVHRVA